MGNGTGRISVDPDMSEERILAIFGVGSRISSGRTRLRLQPG
jgi:hypothetical protein